MVEPSLDERLMKVRFLTGGLKYGVRIRVAKYQPLTTGEVIPPDRWPSKQATDSNSHTPFSAVRSFDRGSLGLQWTLNPLSLVRFQDPELFPRYWVGSRL